ncbi:MarR family winged helix-turn-helix transcriptional regulator [Oricola sp.]|uniref:MarR family winged helix-turn-helix transcriptional regulator n=1 Tax=Oricola sp. TaxID=1979950 RepID=UPI003BAB4C7D
MPDTELALLIDRFMRRIHFGLQAKAAGFDKENVGPGGGIILLTIADMGRPEMSELTRRVSRDKSQMTRTIRTLENKGLVERQVSPSDARVSLVSLTPAGETVVAHLRGAVTDTINEILGPVSPADRDTLRRVLQGALC